ncbi:MAG TPA: pitrilysin family protein [candidate division Zixibacteria bacterium]
MKSLRTQTWLMAVAVAGMAASLTPPADARSPYFDRTFDPIQFEPPTPSRFQLGNGMIVYFLPDQSLPVVTVNALVRAGGVYTPESQTGLASITGETMVTGGTRTFDPDRLDAFIEFRGIRLDGSIGDESGSFSLRCLAEDFDTALSVFAEVLRFPRFDSARVNLALADAREDLRRQNDSPGRIIAREFSKLVYGSHPYGRSATEQTLDAVTRARLIDFHKQFFKPNNIMLAISGSIDGAALKQRLESTFGDWVSAPVDWPQIPGVQAPQPGLYQIAKDINQTNIRFGHLGVERHNPDRYALRVLNDILGGGGFTSRMMESVRSDSGWAYSVGTRFTALNQPGVFYASCQTKAETTMKTLKLMRWIVDDIIDRGISQDELDVAKDAILNSDVFQYETPREIVERYAWMEYYGFPMDQMKKDVEAIAAVTRADVEAAARKYLHPDNYVVLVVGPIDEFDAPLGSAGEVNTIELE